MVIGFCFINKKDLEGHMATLPIADHDFCLDWCFDSGASRHFCNDTTNLYP